jgi:sec-independent protein translocase protein TatA
MFGIHGYELLIVLAIVVLLFGGSRIPSIARSLGQSITEFKRGAKGINTDEAAEEKESKKSDS